MQLHGKNQRKPPDLGAAPATMPPVTDKDQAHVNATVALPPLPSLPPTSSGDLAQRGEIASMQDETDLSLPLPQTLPIDSDTDLGANVSSDG
ncbi:MAG: hypothetical protein KA244_10730, partial [Deltaproteobacteria bacterium]|nr:hypothetical protein [Deltaproteobacteria bacterium]